MMLMLMMMMMIVHLARPSHDKKMYQPFSYKWLYCGGVVRKEHARFEVLSS